ncbi:MAG: nucleotidyltransferase domain-containing protein [Chitinispirillales bacterium]|jgi:predicted nucleotidyltransferase|nr:nucleotidyltransferase domain-containing protein [Chitinispirillales bacterium]
MEAVHANSSGNGYRGALTVKCQIIRPSGVFVYNKVAFDEIKEAVYRASKNVLGDKLEKVLLFGSYARGDFDKESDIDIFVLADIQLDETRAIGSSIVRLVGHLELEYDVVISLHVTCSSIFHKFRSVTPYFMNVLKEGVELSYA